MATTPQKPPWTLILLFIAAVIVTAGLGFLAVRDESGADEGKANGEKLAAEQPTATHPPAPTVAPEYPISGNGVATKSVGLKCWLDPRKTNVQPSKSHDTTVPAPARYVFVDDPRIFFNDTGPGIGYNKEVWWKMPAGKYLVYPLTEEEIHFHWWR